MIWHDTRMEVKAGGGFDLEFDLDLSKVNDYLMLLRFWKKKRQISRNLTYTFLDKSEKRANERTNKLASSQHFLAAQWLQLLSKDKPTEWDPTHVFVYSC